MISSTIKIDDTPIILSRGIFDLLKVQLKKRRLSRFNEKKLEIELKSAIQVMQKSIPENIVTINKRVKVRELNSGEEFIYNLVSHDLAKNKNNTHSILSAIGVAVLGYAEGSKVQWEMVDGIKTFQIIEVSPIQ